MTNIAATLTGGIQVITTKNLPAVGDASGLKSVQVPHFPHQVVAAAVVTAYPEARTRDVEEAFALTSGHPYLVQLLVDSSRLLDLESALDMIRAGNRFESMLSFVLADLPPTIRAILTSLSWLGIPFSRIHVERLGGAIDTLSILTQHHLITRSGTDHYRVHELVSHLVKGTTLAADQEQHRGKAALLLRSLDRLSWLEVRAMLRHALAASLPQVANEAGNYLLKYAMTFGQWDLAREAAESLVRGTADMYPFFILGKCSRMTGEFEAALAHYVNAESHAASIEGKEVARYEQASVLCELGRRPEAEEIYTQLLNFQSSRQQHAMRESRSHLVRWLDQTLASRLRYSKRLALLHVTRARRAV